VILLPEIPFKVENVCEAIRQREGLGRRFSVIAIAEGARLPGSDATGKPMRPGEVANWLAQTIRERMRQEVRLTVLGHLQRGGTPSPFDRTLAARFGVGAVELVERNAWGRMIALRGAKITSASLAEAIHPIRLVDPQNELLEAARAMGIRFGDLA
jgi:ATP-dependent phosphofructokinase / diphosphate-dependent phosphofructokinase